MDDLHRCTERYAELCNYAYECLVGRKGKAFSLRFTFSPYEYHHLSGLQHLEHPKLRRNSERVMKEVLSGSITLEMLQNAANWETEKENALSRMEALAQLETLMDEFTILFDFSKEKLLKARPAIRTQIDADYLVKFQLQSGTTFFFSIKNHDTYCGCSLFTNNTLDYSAKQTKYVVLEKKKIDLRTGEEMLLYRSKSYHPEE